MDKDDRQVLLRCAAVVVSVLIVAATVLLVAATAGLAVSVFRFMASL